MKKGWERSFQITFHNSHTCDLGSRTVRSGLQLNLTGGHNASFEELLIIVLFIINN